MKYYVWLILRIVGTIFAAMLCVSVGGDAGFIAGAGQDKGLWLLVVTLIVLAVLVAWIYRVVWKRVSSGSSVSRRLHYAQWGVFVLIGLIVFGFTLSAWNDGYQFSSQQRTAMSIMNLPMLNMVPASSTQVGAAAVSKDAVQQAVLQIVGEKFVDGGIVLGLLLIFLCAVTVIRLAVWQGQKQGRSNAAAAPEVSGT